MTRYMNMLALVVGSFTLAITYAVFSPTLTGSGEATAADCASTSTNHFEYNECIDQIDPPK